MEITKAKTIKGRLKTTLEGLYQVKEDLLRIDKKHMENEKVFRHYETIRELLDESIHKIENPTLSIATIGTTSSGKSTLLNAMIGHRLAPMEAQEMSAGILTFRHSSDGSLLKIEETKNALWECGEWKGLSDKEIYEHLAGKNGIMHLYHTKINELQKESYKSGEDSSEEGKIKRIRSIEQPRVLIQVPLLPVNLPEFFQMKDNIGFEIVDLPGLKNVVDKKNMVIIQNIVRKAFCIAVLDYSQTDEKNRERILEELKKVVKDFDGKPDCMIFVLNRIDHRTEEDYSIDERIKTMEEEIKKVLEISEDIFIIPMNSLLLYYIQTAWGPEREQPTTTLEEQKDQLKKLKKDCGGFISEHYTSKPEAKILYRKIEDWLDKGGPTDEADNLIGDLRSMLSYCRVWSGGVYLLQELNLRLAEKLSQLVIMPSVSTFFVNYNHFNKRFQKILSDKKTKTVDEVENKLEQLKENVSKIKKSLHDTKKEREYNLNLFFDYLKSGSSTDHVKIQGLLPEMFTNQFNDVVYIFKDIKKDIVSNIIVPIQEHLEKKANSYDLNYALSKTLEPGILSALSREYEEVKGYYYYYDKENKGIRLDVKATDVKKIDEIDLFEAAVHNLYFKVRKSIVSRAEFVLQTKAGAFRENIFSIFSNDFVQLKKTCIKLIGEDELDVLLPMLDFDKDVWEDSLKLPEDIISGELSTSKTTTREEIVGSYKEGSCFPDTKYIKENVNYRVLELPNASGLGKIWLKGLDTAEEQVQGKLLEWLQKLFAEVMAHLEYALDEAEEVFKDELERQKDLIERHLEIEINSIMENEKLNNSIAAEIDSIRKSILEKN
ncbi:MAG: dynamin family protein [Candidatus Xenobiia bacterium LiM19]